MSPSLPLGIAALLGVLSAALPAQRKAPPAYPERDILSPFRTPLDVYAPPDELFRMLGIMQALADAPGVAKNFDDRGREVVDDERWRKARAEAERIGVDAAYLAQIMRLHKNAGDRATAFYGAFFCTNVDDVVNLISHIPGEPERRTRQAAMPRAVAYLRAHLRRRFGDLDDERKKALTAALPEIGSPAAKAAGITRAPRDEDLLYDLRLVPFLQMLDLEEPIDQAQALWFLKEVFLVRRDLAERWLEPALPRVRELLASTHEDVRDEAIGLLRAIGPKDLRQAPVEDPEALQHWAVEAGKALFPPIRNLNDALVQLQPSPERDAIAAAGEKALATSAVGDAFAGKAEDGRWIRGFRVAHVPDELKALAIPAEAVITAVNGVGVTDAASLLRTVREHLRGLARPKKLFVEYVRGGKQHAIEYRVL
jgi:hypothetical protein